MSNPEILEAIEALAEHKGIDKAVLFEALANALETAYKRTPGSAEDAYVVIDAETAEIRVIAREYDEHGNVVREWDDTPDDFGRIAAQTAKQVMMQNLRDVERRMKYEEYRDREGDIVTGIVERTDARYTLLNLGRVEALLPQAEQVPFDRPSPGTRLKAYIVEVRNTAKGPQIVVSRTHPGLIKRLFELEVPEIGEGVVEIKACAREPGHRTKIAVWSNDPTVDPVGACVGARGSRVRQVMNELRGEKIDIVAYSPDTREFIMNALAPAKVDDVILNYETGDATVVVPDYQLSLAIGKDGQNARLAARLTGWRVSIKSQSEMAQASQPAEEWAEGEWVTNPETGELEWHPAGGGPPISEQEWLAAQSAGQTAGQTAGSPEAADEGATASTDGAGADGAGPEGAGAEGQGDDTTPPASDGAATV